MDYIMKFVERAGFSSEIFLNPHLRGDWGVYHQARREIIFHLLVRGTCYVNLGKEKTPKNQLMLPGDIIIYPHGDVHCLYDSQAKEILGGDELLKRSTYQHPLLQYGSKGSVTEFVCGSFALSEFGSDLLLKSLPKQIYIPAHDRSDPQMEQVLRMLASEHSERNVGNQLIIEGLLRILFVLLLRHSQKNLSQAGLLKALVDPTLAIVLKEIHESFQKDWGLDSLAKVAKVSRAKLAKDFHAQVGRTPMKYLNEVRLIEAQLLLRNSNATVKEIGHRVGFKSPEVFVRNFSSYFGKTPTEYRKEV